MLIRQQMLLDLLGEPGLRFTIPRFQRSYSWGAEQCDELWRDILRAARAHRSHFVGTLIYCKDEGGFSVVDGQQRLTTVTLLLLALARHLDETGEQLAGAPDEGPAQPVLLLAGALADEHQLRMGVAFPRHHVVARLAEPALPAIPNLLVKLRPGNAHGSQPPQVYLY